MDVLIDRLLEADSWRGWENCGATLQQAGEFIEVLRLVTPMNQQELAESSHLRKREIRFGDGSLYMERFALNGWMPGDEPPCAMILEVSPETGAEKVCGKRSAYMSGRTRSNSVPEGCCQSCWDALEDDCKWPDANPIPSRTNNVYLHHILLKDEDPAPHSHPWEWGCSLVLSGGYVEKRGGQFHAYDAGAVNVIEHASFHRIISVLPDTWTLFITGPKMSSWGYEVEGRGFVEWRDRLIERGIKPAY